MVKLFLDGEKRNGLLYLKVVGDGDSYVLHHLRTWIPDWGADIDKMCMLQSCMQKHPNESGEFVDCKSRL